MLKLAAARRPVDELRLGCLPLCRQQPPPDHSFPDRQSESATHGLIELCVVREHWSDATVVFETMPILGWRVQFTRRQLVMPRMHRPPTLQRLPTDAIEGWLDGQDECGSHDPDVVPWMRDNGYTDPL
jgi:hypothetical protein